MAAAYTILAATARATAGEPATVVDVGCGPGWWVQHLAAQNVHATGIDLSPAMIALARTYVPHVRFEVGSVLDLPLTSRSVAGVACMYVLHHVPDGCLEQAVAELARVLVPGGALLLGGHIGNSRTTKTSGYGGRPMNVQVVRRPASLYENLARRAGLIIDAHTVYDPEDPAPSHALYARKPTSPTH